MQLETLHLPCARQFSTLPMRRQGKPVHGTSSEAPDNRKSRATDRKFLPTRRLCLTLHAATLRFFRLPANKEGRNRRSDGERGTCKSAQARSRNVECVAQA